MNRTRVVRLVLFALLAGCRAAPSPRPEPAVGSDPPAAFMSTGAADEVSDLAATPDGAALVVGTTKGDADHLFLRRYDLEGRPVWEQKIDRCQNPPFVEGPVEPGTLASCEDWSVAVATDAEGNAYVLSQTYEVYNYGGDIMQAFLSKYRSDGGQLWDVRVAGPGGSQDEGQFVSDFAVDGAGNSYLIAPGEGLGMSSRPQAHLIKFGVDGQRLWEKPAGHPATDTVVMVEDDVYTAGITNPADGSDAVTTELHKLTTDGDLLWTRSVPNPGLDERVSLAVAGGLHVYVVTGVTDLSRVYYDGVTAVTKFDGEGTLLWEKVLTPEPFWGLGGAAADPSGNLYLVGVTENEGFGVESYALRYVPSGTEDWIFPLSADTQGAVVSSTVHPLAVGTTTVTDSYGGPQTRLYVAGFTDTRGTRDAFLLSADDRSDEPDDTMPSPSLELNWLTY